MKGTFLKVCMMAGVTLAATVGPVAMAEAATVSQSQTVTGFANATGYSRPDPFTISFTSLPTNGQNGTLSIQAVGDFDYWSEWVNVILDPAGEALNLGRLFDNRPNNDLWSSLQNPFDQGNEYSTPRSATAAIADNILNNLLSDGTVDALVSFSPWVDNLSYYYRAEEFIELTLSFDSSEIPTPALLPGLIGIGIARFRKKRLEATGEA